MFQLVVIAIVVNVVVKSQCAVGIYLPEYVNVSVNAFNNNRNNNNNIVWLVFLLVHATGVS